MLLVCFNITNTYCIIHPSTDHAQCCLTSVIVREPVFFNIVWPFAGDGMEWIHLA